MEVNDTVQDFSKPAVAGEGVTEEVPPIPGEPIHLEAS